MYRCIIVLSLFVVFVGCGAEQKPVSAIVETTQVRNINLNVATTIGNHTYIPLNLRHLPAYNVSTILQVLNEFEKIHQELKVTGWRTELQQPLEHSTAFTFGIWIDHESRK
jgi:hypothetical protein